MTTDQIIHAAAVAIADELEPPHLWIPPGAEFDPDGAVKLIDPIIRKCCQDFHKEILRMVENE